MKIKFKNKIDVVLSPVNSSQRKENKTNKSIIKSRNKITESITDNGNDVFTFLASGKSYRHTTEIDFLPVWNLKL